MRNKKKKIFLISGDPNSINSEIIFKSWLKLNNTIRDRLYIISNYNLIKSQFQKLKYRVKLKNVKHLDDINKKNEIKIINVELKFKNSFNVKNKDASIFIQKCLKLGHKLSLKKGTAGLINCAINKNLLNKKNFGVTEFLASKCNIKDKSEVMMIRGKNFSVCPITTHIDLKNVSQKIKSQLIITKLRTIKKEFQKLFKKNPNIGILGLNPHNAEFKPTSEEVKEIIPAISFLKRNGYKIKGPLVSDTIFVKDYKNYDILVGMYHDQVLAPFKTIYKFDAINVTLGLKYLRVSPDHGVAANLIRKNKANASSLTECIYFINKFG